MPEADLPGVAAAAGGAYAATVAQAAKLPVALGLALSQLRRGRSAVISVHVPSAAPPPTGSHHPAPVDPGQKEDSS
jgi:acetolactate synthase I/II/III large subunit